MKQTIYTLGTQTVEGNGDERDSNFVALLKGHEIDAVIDIRLHNEGRYYKFASGKNIKALAESHGVKYIHETRFAPTPELLKEWRKYENWHDYEQEYKELMIHRDMLCIWKTGMNKFRKPMLLCAEKDHEHCHRRLLADCLKANLKGVALIHIPGI